MDAREKARDTEPQPEQEEERLDDLELSAQDGDDVTAGIRMGQRVMMPKAGIRASKLRNTQLRP